MSRLHAIITVLATMALVFTASQGLRAQDPETPQFRTLSVEEFEKFIQDKDVTRLDVRAEDEYAEGHIEGTVNIDVLKPTFKKIATDSLDVSKPVALYCRSGRRSKTAAGMLAKSGYTVVELDGGYNAWVEAKRKVVK